MTRDEKDRAVQLNEGKCACRVLSRMTMHSANGETLEITISNK